MSGGGYYPGEVELGGGISLGSLLGDLSWMVHVQTLRLQDYCKHGWRQHAKGILEWWFQLPDGYRENASRKGWKYLGNVSIRSSPGNSLTFEWRLPSVSSS